MAEIVQLKTLSEQPDAYAVVCVPGWGYFNADVATQDEGEDVVRFWNRGQIIATLHSETRFCMFRKDVLDTLTEADAQEAQLESAHRQSVLQRRFQNLMQEGAGGQSESPPDYAG